MNVYFTQDKEKERIQENIESRKNTWEILKTTSLVEAVHKAKELGWKQKKVQVRYEKIDDMTEQYYVEPYESGCGCKGMLKYINYFED